MDRDGWRKAMMHFKTICGANKLNPQEATEKLHKYMKTSEDPIDPLLQVIIYLYTNISKEYFYYLGGKICELSNHNKWTLVS